MPAPATKGGVLSRANSSTSSSCSGRKRPTPSPSTTSGNAVLHFKDTESSALGRERTSSCKKARYPSSHDAGSEPRSSSIPASGATATIGSPSVAERGEASPSAIGSSHNDICMDQGSADTGGGHAARAVAVADTGAGAAKVGAPNPSDLHEDAKLASESVLASAANNLPSVDADSQGAAIAASRLEAQIDDL
eukprot:CAMPEP_0181061080 /NCGR_PEP_ID=MMETSP1070-20121207/22323_1 /TAXON_ID=265543 /ORGANISM="Minutocellus polymorphus, Strain NH13" /LENGTH=192 /DNA_ID=CAMNT_0023140997 /DNA_START=95 /DNA_END=669 /DNA_ORIENTATION=+